MGQTWQRLALALNPKGDSCLTILEGDTTVPGTGHPWVYVPWSLSCNKVPLAMPPLGPSCSAPWSLSCNGIPLAASLSVPVATTSSIPRALVHGCLAHLLVSRCFPQQLSQLD